MSQGLKTIVKQIISKDVFEEDRARQTKQWKVLVLDDQSTRVISSSCKMFDIMNCRVTLVEDIKKNREPLEKLDAIYLVKPTEESVNRLIQDFTPAMTDADIGIRYKAAHVFFTEPCSDVLITKMAKSKAVRYIKTLREINVSFLPYESQVFSLDLPQAFHVFYQEANAARDELLETMADRLATLCVTLNEYPSIRYRIEHQGNIEFAKILQQKLDKYKSDDPSLGEGGEKNQSQLLILDRGFDPVSPLMHELTYQAMAYDLVDIQNDVYKKNARAAAQSSEPVNDTEALLDEKDELWAEFRHQHIADVLKKVSGRFKEFANSHKEKNEDQPTLKDLSQMLKRMPEYKKEISSYSLHLSLADDCMKKFNSDRMKRMCESEQNLALGTDADGEKIKDPLKQIVPSLLDQDINIQDKLRLIMLFILNNNGITTENLQKLFSNTEIDESKKQTVLNLSYMGLQILLENAKQARKKIIPQNRKEREPQAYQLFRWTPYVKDVMEDAAEDKLDQRLFPYLSNKASSSSGATAAMPGGTSARPAWNRTPGGQSSGSRSGPRLIVFIIGGVTYSEMRCAYEVTMASKRWEVFIGSDQILTPKKFLQNLETAGANQTEA